MNRIYRLVFNRALGCVQVVSELARSTQRNGASPEGDAHARVLSPLRLALLLALGWVMTMPALAQSVEGRIVGDPNAPGSQRPQVLPAGNGVPVVNITTPSAAGVSRNTYSQFDVGAQGAILNNATGNAQTQLGGWVQGNPWLATGSARVILNEVNSAHPSHLNGYIEVAGQRAEVIIANPAGIRINGGGFINASAATLTTGTPVLVNGALDHYRVNGGSIHIDGAGLDATHTDYTRVLSRALELNGGLWAKQLDVVLGVNRVDADSGTREAMAAGSTVPRFALDVSALGGMYAHHIALIGTEHGLGVRNAGTLGAQAGELRVTVDGRLENTGTLQSKGDTRVDARGGLANAGTLSAAGELRVTTAADVDNRGGTLNARRIEVNAASLANREGSIEQTGMQALALDAGTLSNRDGGRIGIAATSDGSGEGGGNTGGNGTGGSPGGETGGNTGGGSGGTGGGTPPVVPSLADGVLDIAGLLDNDGGRIDAARLDLASAHGLDNSGGHLGLHQLDVSGGDVRNAGGELTISGAASFHVGTLNNDAGRLNVAGPLILDAQRVSNRAGALQHSGTGATTFHVATTLDNTGGTVATNATALTLQAGTFVNERGQLLHAGTNGLQIQTGAISGAGGTVATAGSAKVDATTVDHRDATLSATQVNFLANSLDNRGGQITATGEGANALRVRDTLDNGDGGTISSNGDLTIQTATFGNAGGTVQQAGSGMLDITATTLNGAGGTLVSNGALSIAGMHTDLRAGTTRAQRMRVETGTLITAGGQLVSTGPEALFIRAGRLDNTDGTVGSQGHLDLQAGQIANARGNLIAAGPASSSIIATDVIDNQGGVLSSHGNLTVRASGLLNRGGSVLAADASWLDVGVTDLLDNQQGGRLAAGGDLRVAASGLDNRSGGIEHAGTGTLTLDADVVRGAGGSIGSNGALRLTAAEVDVSGATTQAASLHIDAGRFNNAGGTLSTLADGALALRVTDALNNDGGSIFAGGPLWFAAGSFSNRSGSLLHAGTEQTRLSVTGSLDNSAGVIASNAVALAVHSAGFVNERGQLEHAGAGGLALSTGRFAGREGTLATAGALTLTATEVAHQDATLSAASLRVNARNLDNTGGRVLATGPAASTLHITGTLDNTDGTVASNGDLALTTARLVNGQGTVQQAGAGLLEIHADTLSGRNGTLLSNGALQLSGDTTDVGEGLVSAQAIRIDTGDLTTAGGRVIAAGNGPMQLYVQRTFDNTGGTLAAQGTMQLTARQFLNASGTVQATGTGASALHVSDAFENRGGTLQTQGAMRVEAGRLDNQGGTIYVAGAAPLTLSVEGVLDNREQGVIGGAGSVEIAAGALDNRSGTVGAEGDLHVQTRTSLANAGGTLQSGGKLAIASDALDNAAGTLVGGSVVIDMQAGALDNTHGTVASTTGDLTVRSGALDNTAGLIQSSSDISIDTQGQALINAQSGATGGILGAGDVTLRSGLLDNRTGAFFAQGDLSIVAERVENAGGSLSAATDLALSASSLGNAGGRVQAGHDAVLALSGALDNRAGQLAAGNALGVSAGTLDNRDTAGGESLGVQASNVHITANHVDNRQGLIASGSATGIALTGQLDNASGQISSTGTVDVVADAITNTGGTVLSGDDLTLTARALSGDGSVLSQRDATLTLVEDFENSGEITANGKLSLATQGALHNAGMIQAGQLEVQARDIENAAGGEIAAVGEAHLVALDTFTNRGLLDGAVTHIEAGVLDNVGTGRIYGDHVAIDAGQLNNRAETADGATQAAVIAARERLDIGADRVDNSGQALILSDGDAAIGGALDASRTATGIASVLVNRGSVIEVTGDLDIQARAITNERENVVVEQVTTVKAPVRLDQPEWRHNGGNSTSDIRSTSNYAAYEVYYLNPADILEDEPYITPDGHTLRRAVVRMTPQTTAYFFARGGLHRALGERSRMEAPDGTVTIYYRARQDHQVNPDQAATGADDPFAELSEIEPGSPGFSYVSDTLDYSSDYGTCTTDCVQIWTEYQYTDPDHILLDPRNGGSLGANEHYRVATQTVVEDVLVSAGPDAIIHAGGNMTLGMDALTNRYGRILAGGDLDTHGLSDKAPTLTNLGLTLFRTYSFDNVSHAYNGSTSAWSQPSLSETTGTVGGVISAGGTLTVDRGAVSNLDEGRDAPNVRDGGVLANLELQGPGSGPSGPGGPVSEGPGALNGQAAQNVTGHEVGAATGAGGERTAAVQGSGVNAGAGAVRAADGSPDTIAGGEVNVQLPVSRLYKVAPLSGQYLVETDPQFANHRQWLGSDYLLRAMGHDPSNVHKRLGDGYYEQKLVREQIGQLTGRRFLSGYSNEEAQFRALMDAGGLFAQQFGLRPGVALSAAQMAQLTSDIVWLVEETVTLADGSTQTVLVPRVYLRLQPGDLRADGAMLAGENVRLNLDGDLLNTGHIAGRNVVDISGRTLQNLAGGDIRGRVVGLEAQANVDIIGATVHASDALSVKAGGDVTVASTTRAWSDAGGNAQTQVERVAGLYVTNPGGLGVLSVQAGGDVLLKAAQVRNAGVAGLTQVRAGGDLRLETVSTGVSEQRVGYQASRTVHVGTDLQGAGAVALQAGRDVHATAAQVSAGEMLSVQAGRDLRSDVAVDEQSRTLTERRNSVSTTDETVRGSTFTAGGDMALQAGRDVHLTATTVNSQAGTVALVAGRDVTLDTAEETHTLTQDTTKKKHGTFSSTTTRTQTEVSDTQLVGTAISGAQGVQMVAGRDVNAVAASVYSRDGAVAVVAERDVNLLTGQESHTAVQDTAQKKWGVVSNARANSHSEIQTTTAVGTILSGETVGILAGRDINVVGSTVVSDIDTTLMAGRDVMITSAQDTMHQSSSHYSKSSGLAGGYGGGVLSAGYSSSRTSSQGTSDAVTQVASSVLSLDGNTTVKAGNTLTVKASDLGARQDLTLIAKDIQLLAQQDTTEERNRQESKSSGFSVGLTLNPVEAYQGARDGATNNMPEGGSAMTRISRTAEGMASGTRAATTPVVVQAGSQRSQGQDSLGTSTARTSHLVAGNDLTLLATDGSITSQGAQLSAEGDALLLARQNILLDVAHNIEAQSGDSSASGWSLANNTTGLPVGQLDNQGRGRGASDTITGTQLSVGGTTTLISQEGDITLTAANLVSGGDMHINAARHLTIQSGQDRVFNENQVDNQAVGTVVLSDTERFVGYHTEKHNDNSTRVTQVASNVGSLNGNVSLNAGGTYTQTASNVLAGRDISVSAREIQLLTADNTGSQHVDDETLKIGVFGRVSSPLIDLVNNAEAVRHSDGRLQAMHGMAAVAGGYQAYNALSQGNLANVEAGIGFATSESRLDGSYQGAQGSTLGAGGHLSLTTTEGDIHVVQGNLKAGNALSLDSAHHILLEAGQSQASETARGHYSGAEVGVGASVGAQTGVYVYAQASTGSSKSDGKSTTYQNTQLTADTLNLTSRGDTTLRGADGHAGSIDADIGGTLTIESLQDSQTQIAKSSEVGGRVQVSFGTAWSASGNASSSSVESDYLSVGQQSGLFAGSGGFDIDVAGGTSLKGAAIASAADASKNHLSTGSLTATDLQNAAAGNASYAAVHVSSDMFSGSKYDASKGVAQNLMGSGSDGDSRSSMTASDIAAGTVIVRNGDTQALEAMARTATTPAEALEKIDLQKLQDHAAAEQIGKALVYDQAVRFTDEAYRTMFLEEAKVYVVEKDSEGKPLPPRELTVEEKFNLQPASDGKVHIADNGINNDLKGADKYAQQHSSAADGPQYFIHFPKAENGLSELLIAGYQKYLESDALGLANATDLTREYMLLYGQEGLHLDGHSRGSLTVGNAMESLENLPGSSGLLSGTTVAFFGPAYNAAAADDLLGFLQDRGAWGDPQSGVLTLQNHENDIVGGWIGFNPSTGGVTPSQSNTVWEMLRVLGGEDTPHNCYGKAAGPGCGELWKGYPNSQSAPVPINQIPKSRSEELIYLLEAWRGSFK